MITREQQIKNMEKFIEERRKLKAKFKAGEIAEEELSVKTLELRLLYLNINSVYGTKEAMNLNESKNNCSN